MRKLRASTYDSTILVCVMSDSSQAMGKQVVCNNTRLWEALHSLFYITIHTSIVCYAFHVITFHHFIWVKANGYSDVFVIQPQAFPSRFLNVTTHVYCYWGGNETSEQYFVCAQMHCWDQNITWIVDQIYSHHQAYLIWVVFLGSALYHNASTYHILSSVYWNFFIPFEENGVRFFYLVAYFLRQPS